MCRHEPENCWKKAHPESRKAQPSIVWVICPRAFTKAAQRGMYDVLMDWVLNKPAFDGPCWVKQTKDIWILAPDPGCEL